MDEKIIDINPYLRGFAEGRAGKAFSVWGGDGLRARFALPVWRAIALLEGERGGIVLLPSSEDHPRPFFVLDLVGEPARSDCSLGSRGALREEEAPAIALHPEGEVAVFLGANQKGSWYLQVWGGSTEKPLGGKDRETLLFLAGECAGLLFYRELTGSGA